MRICSVEACDRLHYARGWCCAHYCRWRTHGDAADLTSPIVPNLPTETFDPNNPNDPRHGANGYRNLGCRCDACRQGWAVYHKQLMDKHPEWRENQRAYMREYDRTRRPTRR